MNNLATRTRIAILMSALVFTLALPAFGRAAEADTNYNYVLGRGVRDVTGPAVGLQMFGFVRADQIDEGIHIRLWSRAFVIAESGENKPRIAFVSVDIGSVTHQITLSVLDRLREKYGETYNVRNTIISATHTHAGPAGFWHYGANTIAGGPFYEAHFNAIVAGIADSIIDAHESAGPGRVLIARGRLDNAGAQRSAPAYLNNPESERAQYEFDTDRDMTLLRLETAAGPIGVINWFAVHPTTMTYYNKLISGDHKGYASMAMERQFLGEGGGPTDGGPFVAAFAQSNCGDVTSNLNLNNTGPGKDDFESTKIIGERQMSKARELFDSATEPLTGPIDARFNYVDFSKLAINEEYTGGHGAQSTCASAYGYPFAAGSTEDGGGLPMFKEGMLQSLPMIEGLIKQISPLPPPPDSLRACQAPKVILLAPGATDPPSQAQVMPLTLARIGQFVMIAGPAEYTTMSGRRIRASVDTKLGDWAKHLVIAGYSNDYSGYCTTYEEYQTQQYEGGHTLFGPWTLAGYQQEFARLAQALETGSDVKGPEEARAEPYDIRGKVESAPLGNAFDRKPEGAAPGDVHTQPDAGYKRGATVTVAFWSGHPQNGYKTGGSYLEIQRAGDGGAWETVATDNDWETKIRWTKPVVPGQPTPTPVKGQLSAVSAKTEVSTDPLIATITWDIPESAKPGKYRVVFIGTAKDEERKEIHPVRGESADFVVE